MLDMNEFITIRSLHERGASIKTIARDLHMARNTVRKYLRTNAPPEFKLSQDLNPALAPFVAEIQARLKEQRQGSQILRELRRLGYTGPQATFYRYLARELKAHEVLEPIQRFETSPGHQAQYDWSEYVIPGPRAPVKVYISCLILGYSRYRHYHISLDITRPSIFEAIEVGFHAFGGVPREVLFDNPRALVIRVRPHLVWTNALLAFAQHCHFLPRACWPYRAQTKGKVENPFRYLERNFITGLVWLGLPDFTVRLKAFEQEVNDRPHGTTGLAPQAGLAEERPLLFPVNRQPFISPEDELRHVSLDSLFPFAKRRYSVPWRYAGKTVWVKVRAGAYLEVYSQAGALIARHTVERGPRRVIIKAEHYAGLHERHQLQKGLLAETFKARFPTGERFLEKLLSQYKFNATDQLRKLLRLAEEYAPALLQTAFEQALVHNTFSANFVQGVLEHLTADSQEPPSSLFKHQLTLPGLDIKPDLNRYQELLDRASEQSDPAGER